MSDDRVVTTSRRRWVVRALGTLLGASLLAPVAAIQPAATEMRDFFRSRWTYQPAWSPDGARILYLQDDWERQDLFVVEASAARPRKLSQSTRFIGNPRGNSAGQMPVWSPDSSEILYAQDGTLKIVSVASGEIRDFGAAGEQRSGGSYSPDGRIILFSSKGQLHLFDRGSGATRALTAPEGRSFGGAQWSPDGSRLAVSAGTAGESFTLVPPYVGRLISFPFGQPGSSVLGTLAVATGSFTPLPSNGGAQAAIAWSPDGRSLLIERTSSTFKERSLAIVDLATNAVKTIVEERDDRYLPLARAFGAYVGSDRLVFTSERSGWNHLYAYDTRADRTEALTEGPFEVRDVAVGTDGWVYYTSSEAGAARPQAYRVRASGGARVPLTNSQAVHSAVAPHPTGKQVLYLRSDPKSLPDVWIQGVEPGAMPSRLSASNPPSEVISSWQEPTLVTFPGHDGLPISAQLFVPAKTAVSRGLPAIVHVHQAASYQDVYFGPGPQKDNVTWYAWHQRLAQRGYVVLNVDYRGSTGYGRNYRTANYRDLGGGDHLDAVSGVRYLETLGYVDVNRVGIYGMSYGGHLVLSALTKSPDVFKAGIDIAGVADMRMVYETAGRGAVVSRLGTPDESPDLYRTASALTFVDRITAPVMILHGTDDPNVSILQSLRLVDVLLAHGKRFEFEIYPGELHFFTRARSWIDAFAKMERFLDQALAPPASRH